MQTSKKSFLSNYFYCFLALILCANSLQAQAQAPANDDKANAMLLTLSAQGEFDSGGNIYTVVGATADETLPPNWAYGLDGNVWFKFVAQEAILNIKIKGGMINKMAALYDNLGAIIMSKTGPYKGNLGILIEDAVVGQEYHLNIDGRISKSFGITISSEVTYDYKNYAETLLLSPIGEFDTGSTAFSLAETTPDENTPPSWSYGLDGNVWFEFEATHPIFNLIITGNGNNKQAALYDSNMTILQSKTGPHLGNLGILHTLVVGAKYYLNIDGRSASSTFGLKISSTVGFDYKDYAEVLVLDVQGNLETANNAYSLALTTPDKASPNEATPPNWSYGLDGNVWFKFTATQSILNLVMTGEGYNKQAALYDSGLNLIESKTGPYNGNLGILQNLVVGEEYYLNVDGRSQGSTFGFKISSTIGFDYKEYAEALALDAQGNLITGDNAYTLLGSTVDKPQPANWSYGLNHNVWFKFRPVSFSTNITIIGALNDKMVAIYDSNENVVYSQTGPYLGDHEIVLNALDVQQDYYLNIDGRTFNTFGLKVESVYECKNELWAIASGDWSDPNIWSDTEGGQPVSVIPCENTVVYIKGFDVSFNSTNIVTAQRVQIIGTSTSVVTRLHLLTGELNVKEEVVTSGPGVKLHVAGGRIKVTGSD